MKFGVVMFPGSNCDHDTYHVVSKVIGQPVDFIWHRQRSLGDCDAVILPGGFSYGDYLRTGAIARFSPVMGAIKEFASRGGLVMGICNGFQILCEAGLLPGALMRNKNLKFICGHLNIRVETTNTPFTNRCQRGQVLSVPIAHGDGNYFCDAVTLAIGKLTNDGNPNGSLDYIAGICNRERNVLGMMPHPERASEQALGSNDGRIIFYSLADTLAELAKAS
jgi:phosphoribosylformylglycinamidine synthase I